jgi:hypothetical protein
MRPRSFVLLLFSVTASGFAACSAPGGGGDAGSDAPAVTCDPGLTVCDSACVDVQNDAENCGGCGTSCPVACYGGACVTSCPAPTVLCGKACVTGTATLSGDVQPVFTTSCAINGCHAGVKPQQGMLLTSGNTYSNVVNAASTECSGRTRVVPGNVDQSYLVDKLLGKNLCTGSQMPKIGSSLAAAQLNAIRAWICSGAPDN